MAGPEDDGDDADCMFFVLREVLMLMMVESDLGTTISCSAAPNPAHAKPQPPS